MTRDISVSLRIMKIIAEEEKPNKFYGKDSSMCIILALIS